MGKAQYSERRSVKSRIVKSIKRPVKKALNALSEKNSTVRKLYQKSIRGKRKNRYEKYASLPIDKKLIIFECFRGRQYADSPRALYEYIISHEEYSDYHFIWFFKEKFIDKYNFLEANDRTELGMWGSADYYKACATAGYWITNSRDPLDIGVRDGQAYVQCWHGTPLKRLRLDIEVEGDRRTIGPEDDEQNFLQDAARFTHFLSPSAFCTEKFISAFGLDRLGKEDIIVEEGYPRNDYIVNHTADDEARIKAELGIPADKKVILYAPTWRDNQFKADVGYVYEQPIDFERLHQRLGDGYVVLFRAHYLVANSFDFSAYGDYVINACNYPEINDLYVVSDILITDYSSVFFDYGILKRPVIFYMYDLEEYRDNLRGFYIGLDELPGPIIEKEDELLDKLATVDEWFSSQEIQDKYKAFNDKFTYLDDGHAAERVVKRIIG